MLGPFSESTGRPQSQAQERAGAREACRPRGARAAGHVTAVASARGSRAPGSTALRKVSVLGRTDCRGGVSSLPVLPVRGGWGGRWDPRTVGVQHSEAPMAPAGGAPEGSPHTADLLSRVCPGLRVLSPGLPSTHNTNIFLKDSVNLTHGSYPLAKPNTFRNL